MKALRYLDKYLRKYRLKLFAGIIITVISRIFSLFAPRLIGNSLTTVEKFLSENQATLEEVKEILLINILIIRYLLIFFLLEVSFLLNSLVFLLMWQYNLPMLGRIDPRYISFLSPFSHP